MPASCTHAYFGNKVFDLLDDEIKHRILPYKSHYMMGLYGPDPLFFYKAYKRNSVNDYGDKIHSQEAYLFFERGRTIYQNSSNKDACLAYLCGFMNHFILDSELHGYVNEAEKQYHVSHARIEADLDRAILVREGLKASSTSYTHFMFPSQDVTDIMADFLDVDKELMLTTVKHMKLFNNDLFIEGVLLTMLDSRTNLGFEVVEYIIVDKNTIKNDSYISVYGTLPIINETIGENIFLNLILISCMRYLFLLFRIISEQCFFQYPIC